MGISRIHFKDRAVDVPDGAMEVFLRLLVDEIDREPAPPDWLRSAREDWQLAATGEFGFGVIPELDAYLTDDSRKTCLLGLADRARARLDALGVGAPESVFEGDIEAATLLTPIDAFLTMLRAG